jgi:hypothetical protein
VDGGPGGSFGNGYGLCGGVDAGGQREDRQSGGWNGSVLVDGAVAVGSALAGYAIEISFGVGDDSACGQNGVVGRGPKK